ncbi:hypothetical protein GW846_01035 [Candidatus Gracilibacteria bacterium]|nr:hypothetical protein [Candidatus Gracilibacteria bacterium]
MFRLLMTYFLGKKYSKYLTNNKQNIQKITQSSPLAATLVEKVFKLLFFWRFLIILWYIFVGGVILGFVYLLITLILKFMS